MKIFKAEQVREADAYTIKHEPISSLDLMERASKKISNWIKKKYNKNQKVAILVGPGNNGGDGLVVARHLIESGYFVKVYDMGISQQYSPDFEANQACLLELDITSLQKWDIVSIDLNEFDLIVDAIFGSGLNRAINGQLAEAIHQINLSLTQKLSIDIPSGLFAEDNTNNKGAIFEADYTLSFQFPKLAFLFPEHEKYVGQFRIFDIGIHQEFIKKTESSYYFAEQNDIDFTFLRRKNFSHKGTYGHALMIAGSKGKMGAAVLSVLASLRSGTGLVSALIPEDERFILQTASPESMCNTYTDKTELPELENFSAIGIGPGLGQSELSIKLFRKLLKKVKLPTVFDADALNILASKPELLDLVPKQSIFTPHLKELERLIGPSLSPFDRLYKTLLFAKKQDVFVLIKGANSCIVSPEGDFCFNSTGNPGMATAGSGDVLTGIITGLLAQGLSSFEALQTAVFVHGFAGDLAQKKQHAASMIATDIIRNIGKAYKKLGDTKG